MDGADVLGSKMIVRNEVYTLAWLIGLSLMCGTIMRTIDYQFLSTILGIIGHFQG